MHRRAPGRAGLGMLLAVVLAAGVALWPAPARAAAAPVPSALKAISAGGSTQADNIWAQPLRAGAPVGWIMVIHGGGWSDTGPTVTDAALSAVTSLRSAGWGVYDVDYRFGVESLPDVVAAYRTLRAQVGMRAPVCIFGQSAGATLALLLAARRSSVRCVISEAGLIDLNRLASQPAWAPAGLSPEIGPEWTTATIINPIFGVAPSVLATWSPVTYAASIQAEMLLGGSAEDWVVPESAQMAELAAAAPLSTDTMLLDGATTPPGEATNFPHASITAAASAQWTAAELRLLDWEAGRSQEPFTG